MTTKTMKLKELNTKKWKNSLNNYCQHFDINYEKLSPDEKEKTEKCAELFFSEATEQ